VKTLFINRKAEISKLTKGLPTGKDYILIGPRRFGKTKLSLKVLEELSKDKNNIIIHIDLMAYTGGSIKSIAERIIEKILNSLGIMGKLRKLLRHIDLSMKLRVKFQDLEIEPILQGFREDDEWKLLEQALNLPEKIAFREKKRVIVFYDEFGELHSLGEGVIKLFRSVIQLHKGTSYLFAGSQETVMNKIFLEKSGAFYRFGEIIQIKELDKDDVYKYIADNYPDLGGGGLLDYKILDTLITILKGHPYYTAQVIEHFENNPNCTLDELIDFISIDLYERERAYLEQQLLKLKDTKYAIDILRIIALGLNPSMELQHQMLKQNVNRVIRYLENSGYIRTEGKGLYHITDPMLEILLKND